ncbi:MAG: VIT family protein [Corynebacterium sp.]|nr:VIT family protein [Corynebacterium sp.]
MSVIDSIPEKEADSATRPVQPSQGVSYSQNVNDEHNVDESGQRHSHARLNSLRAGVLGANDGIVSISALLLGVIASGVGAAAIFIAGMAATIAGAVSMALGEYVSVSTQRDTEQYLVDSAERNKASIAQRMKATLIAEYGMSEATAAQAAAEIASTDPVAAELKFNHGIDSEELTSPWHAALWSAIAFLCGAILPMLAIFILPSDGHMRVVVVAGMTLIALAVTGYVSATIANTSRVRSVIRLILGGALGLAVTYIIGSMFGVAA